MTSFDEQQLALAAAVGGDTGANEQRVAKLHGAVERLNDAATRLRGIAADVEWRGDAAEAARAAFVTLAGTLNRHADAINAVAAADAQTAGPLHDAYRAYHEVQSVVDTPGVAYYGMGPNEDVPAFRARLAAEARKLLVQGMDAARARLVAAASWYLEPADPSASTSPGGVDPTGPVTRTVPPGSSSPASPGGFDPTGPVTGTVPPGSSSPASPGGFDPTGPVTGTVPPGSTSVPPSAAGAPGSDFDPTGPVTGTVPDGSTSADPGQLRDPGRAAELARRLG